MRYCPDVFFSACPLSPNLDLDLGNIEDKEKQKGSSKAQLSIWRALEKLEE